MATQVQFRRGTTSQNNAFTGAQGELTIDTDVFTIRIHDGTTPGGKTVPTLTATQTFTNKTIGSNSVWNGNSIGLGYGGTGAALSGVAGAIVYSQGSAFGLSLAGTSGQVLTSGGTSGPTWVNASALSTGTATSAVTAQNILGGSAGYLMYQTDTDTTGFITPGSTGYVLKSTGASTAPSWVSPTITFGSTALNLGTTYTDIDGVNTFYITGTTDASSDTTGVLRVAGGASVKKNLYVGGNLIVNGTTTTINSTTLTVDDKNIEIGSVDTPTNTTANGGGITLKGDTDKTIIWDSSNSNWTSSEHWNIASGKSFKIATVPVLTSTTVLNDSSQTSIGIGGYATTVSFGASTGKTTINSTDDASSNTSGAVTVAGGVSIQKKLYVGSDTVLTGDLQVKGGDLTTDQTTFNLLNTTATTLNIGGASTTTNIGSTSSGTTTVGYDLTVNGDVQIKGGDLTTNQTTFNVINTTATTVNAFGAATTIGIGASTGTLTVNNAATVFNSTSNIKLPVGDISQRPGSPSAGMVRYNSEISSFEGYASGAWSSLGGVKSVDGLTYILAETSAGASNDELEFYTATDDSNTAKRGGWNKTRLLVNTPILIGTNASLTDFPNAKFISSTGNTGDNHVYNAGVVGEGVASGSDDTIWGVGVYGVGASNGSTKSAGVLGDGHVSNSSDTGSAVGVRGYSVDTHSGGLNVGLFGTASNSSVGNYALWMEAGNIMSNAAQTWTLYDNQSSALSLGSTGKADIIKVITTDGAEGVTMSGTLGVTGNATFSGTASITGTLGVTGNQTNTGDLAVNGGDITTTSTTATVFNTNATTVNAFGAATTLNIGASSSGSAINVGKDLYVAGNLYVTGTQSTGSIATVSGADSVIYVSAGATGNTKEIGIIGEYKPSGTTLYTGLLKDHTDSTWKFYSAPTSGPTAGTTQDFTGATYDAVKMGALTSTTGTFSTALNSTGDFKVNTNKFVVTASSGNTTVAGTLGVTSDLAVNTNKFTVAATTGNTAVAGTLSVTGHVTVESVTSTGATGTGAFVFGTSPSLTTPSLGVATATSINKMAITAPATSSTLAVADGKTFTVSNTLTLTGTDSSSVAFGTGGTVTYTSNKLSVFSATSSSELAGVISDETGSGVLVFGTSPTFTTSIDSGATFGAFASSTTLTLGYTGTGAGSTTNISTAATSGAFTKTVNIGTSGTTGSTTNVNIGSSVSGTTTINGTLSLAGSTSGSVKLKAAATAGSVTYTLPSADASVSGYALTSDGSGTLSWSAVVSGTSSNTQVNSLGVGTAASGTAGQIRATGSITSYYSDDRLKTRTGGIENALQKILSLDGFHYHANETAVELGYDASIKEVGLSAQQVQAVLPEIVVPAPIDDKYLTIQYERMIPLLVEAIKEQQKQIEELKAKLGN